MVPVENKNEGYIYKPHKKIQIREFSSFPNTPVDLQNVYDTYNITSPTEQLKLKKAYGVPDYAIEIGVGSNVFKWRSLLDIGETDALGTGVDYPFESGAHYIYLHNRFYWERQDPPCDFSLTSESVTLGTGFDDRDKFLEMLTRPTYFDYDILNKTDYIAAAPPLLSNYNGFPPIDVDVRFFSFFGTYNLGERDTPGACVDFSLLKTKDIDDVC